MIHTNQLDSTKGQRRRINLGHSPDPDDAFMWFALADFVAPDGQRHKPKINTHGFDFVHVLEDIQSLNDRTESGELEVTALSIHQYAFVADRYALTSCGASMGDDFGPMIVCRDEPDRVDWSGLNLAIPGWRTSAWLACQLFLREQGVSLDQLSPSVLPFDQIMAQVVTGEFDAGLIIHEGQLTYGAHGLKCLVDLGAWWTRSRGLPLPLGGNAIRRDLGIETSQICSVLLESIRYGLEHRNDAISFALNYARDLHHDLADRFIEMYVNQWTLDCGSAGHKAINQFIQEGIQAGLVPDIGEIDFIKPGTT